MKKMGRITVMGLIGALALSSLCIAANVDLPNMTTAELKELKEQIEEEIDANHDTTYEEENKIEEVSKSYVESVYGEDNVDWAWIDYTYTKDWNFYTMKTHADIKKQDGGSADYDVYTEVINDSNQYEVVYVTIGTEEILNERSKIKDSRVRKSLGLEGDETETGSAEGKEKTENAEQEKDEPTEEPSEDVQLAAKGDENDTVKTVQEMLIRLQYLDGNADGKFGGHTEEAVMKFQTDNGLTADGIVTQSVYDAIKAKYDVAPIPKEYQTLSYTEIQRNPGSFKGTPCKFSGTVLQVSEGWFGSVTLRIGQDGSYDNVWYVNYSYDDGESKILEDDYVIVYGTCQGTETYTTIMGASVTIPSCDAEKIELS